MQVRNSNIPIFTHIYIRIKKHVYYLRNGLTTVIFHFELSLGGGDFAIKARWQASNVIFTSDFEPSLNYTDALYGTSLQVCV